MVMLMITEHLVYTILPFHRSRWQAIHWVEWLLIAFIIFLPILKYLHSRRWRHNSLSYYQYCNSITMKTVGSRGVYPWLVQLKICINDFVQTTCMNRQMITPIIIWFLTHLSYKDVQSDKRGVFPGGLLSTHEWLQVLNIHRWSERRRNSKFHQNITKWSPCSKDLCSFDSCTHNLRAFKDPLVLVLWWHTLLLALTTMT